MRSRLAFMRRTLAAGSISLEAAAEHSRGANNFDLLRLLAAAAVILAHSFELLKLSDPLTWAPGYTWGFLGVTMFFAISGFLVSRSWDRRPDLLDFGLRRALRLMPGLIVALLLTTLVLGTIVTTEPIHNYLQDPTTKDYLVSNAVLQTRYVLPGVFAHVPFATTMNGSLWTLPVEVKAYIVVALAGMLGAFRGGRRWLLPVLAVLALALAIQGVVAHISLAAHAATALSDIQMTPALVAQIRLGVLSSVPEVFAAFLVSASLYAFRSRVLLRWDLALLCSAAIIGAGFAPGEWPTATAAMLAPYVVLCIAYRTPPLHQLKRVLGDPSYGMYIYAFPIQQLVIQLLSPSSGWVVFVVSLPLTLVVAVASWWLVEVRALALKTRVTGGEAPPGMAAVS